MQKLSNNFYLNEFTTSQTATRRNIRNDPTISQVYNLRMLCQHVLQPLRDHVAHPIHISSGFRSDILNSLIGGSKTSQHKEGKAADLIHPTDNVIYFEYIKDDLPFDQLIFEFGDQFYPAWIHVSFNQSHNRGEVLRAVREHGQTVYKPY